MMKKGILVVLVGIGLLSLTSSCKTSVKQKEWKLVWVENFNQKGTFDANSWTKIPRGTSDWNRRMSDFDSCYAMRDGNLVLRGMTNHTEKNDTSPYLTGGLYTKNKVFFTGGRIEVRAKLQAARGAWPAIWLLPENAPWPQGGEIDIMERLNSDSIAYQTVHSYYTHHLNIKDNPKQGGINRINPDDYNVYAVEIYRDSIVFDINGSHTHTYPRIKTDKKGQFPFYQPMYLLVDMQLGGSWVGGVDSKDLPVEMLVDWVKYYEKR